MVSISRIDYDEMATQEEMVKFLKQEKRELTRIRGQLERIKQQDKEERSEL